MDLKRKISSLSPGDILFAGAFILLNAALLWLAFIRLPIITEHTSMFVVHHFYNMPLYSLMLAAFKFVSGAGYLQMVSRFQAVMVMAGALGLSLVLRHHFRPGRAVFTASYLILLLPLFEPGFLFSLSNLSFANISSEPLAYVFLLASMAFAVSYIFKPKIRGLLWLLLFMFLTATTRPQFVFLFPVCALLVLYGFFRTRSRRRLAQSLLLVLAFLAAASLFEKTYNHFVHGQFATIPRVWRQWLIPHLYFSQPGDAALFDNPEEKEFFLRLHQQMRAMGTHSSQRNTGPAISFAHHYASFAQDKIRLTIIPQVFSNLGIPEQAEKKGPKLSSEQLVSLEGYSRRLFKQLAFREKADYFRLMASQLLYGHSNNFCFLLLICAALPVLWTMWQRTGKTGYFALLFLWSLHPINCAFILMNITLKHRYAAFTLNILCAVFGSLLAVIAKDMIRSPGLGDPVEPS